LRLDRASLRFSFLHLAQLQQTGSVKRLGQCRRKYFGRNCAQLRRHGPCGLDRWGAGAPQQDRRILRIVLKRCLQGVTADLELIAIVQHDTHAGAERTAVMQDDACGAQVLDPELPTVVDHLGLLTGDQPPGIGQRQS
jgi:hypothetical protein